MSKEFLGYVAKQEGFSDVVFKNSPDGLVMPDKVLVNFDDNALILHEIAHLKRARVDVPVLNGDKTGHDAIFADIFTALVREYMMPIRKDSDE